MSLELLKSPFIIDLIILGLIIETLLLIAWRRQAARRRRWLTASNAVAGIALLCALRIALADGAAIALAAALLVALAAHAADLRLRFIGGSEAND
jgi:hypothetical protein